MSALNSSSLSVGVPQRLLGPDINDAGDHVAPQSSDAMRSLRGFWCSLRVTSIVDTLDTSDSHCIAVFFLSPRAQPNMPDVPNVASSTRPSAVCGSALKFSINSRVTASSFACFWYTLILPPSNPPLIFSLTQRVMKYKFNLLSPAEQPVVFAAPLKCNSTSTRVQRAAQSQDVDLIFRGPTSKALFGKSPARKSTNAYLMRHAVKDAFLHGLIPSRTGVSLNAILRSMNGVGRRSESSAPSARSISGAALRGRKRPLDDATSATAASGSNKCVR
ncbi:hypothetical protein B0H13DRAFT_1867852 [Mycena leptocephala]|nr:hypothetical protein B0H13DRAFT_1867852 [Mycena leptocephala]